MDVSVTWWNPLPTLPEYRVRKSHYDRSRWRR